MVREKENKCTEVGCAIFWKEERDSKAHLLQETVHVVFQYLVSSLLKPACLREVLVFEGRRRIEDKEESVLTSPIRASAEVVRCV